MTDIMRNWTGWTPEKEAILLRMRKEGKSNSYIAKALGCSPGAAAGKWDRLSGRDKTRGNPRLGTRQYGMIDKSFDE